MRVLVRSQLAAAIASIVDLLVMILLVEGPGMAPENANLGGNVAGGVVNFLMNRQWTFMSKGRMAKQGLRYAMVWGGYMLLSYAAILVGTDHFGFHYLLVKIVVAVALGIGYNFMLHKHFVFK